MVLHFLVSFYEMIKILLAEDYAENILTCNSEQN